MESQLSLPEHAEPKAYEYYPGGDDAPPWSVEDWRALCEEFQLTKGDVLHWHEALAGQGRPWLVIRRIFHVAPVYGPEAGPDDMRQWKWKELAEAQGVPEARLRQDLEAAKDFWKKERLAKSVSGRSREAGPAAGEPDGAPVDEKAVAKAMGGLPTFTIHQEMAKEDVAEILAALRFDHHKDPGDRLYIANRCLELKQFLEDKHQRESTRQLIGLEIMMGAYELTQATLKQRLNAIRDKDAALIGDKTADEVTKLATALEKNEAALAALAKRHGDLAQKLGADDLEEGEKKREALGTISYFADAHRRYYESGDRQLVDGVFTADEVVWLTTPLTIRPAQYRADVVIRAREAMQPENLWDRNYEPKPVQREACRRLAELVQALAEEMEPEKIAAIDTDGGENSSPVVEEVPPAPPVAMPVYELPAAIPAVMEMG